MSLYLQYEDYKAKYLETQKRYDDILSEKEQLFERTQPQGVRYDQERTSGGSPVNKFDEYLISKDKKRIDERLSEVKSLLEDRERLLKLKEKELRSSNDIWDKIYYMRYIDYSKIAKIARTVNYSEMQVYRILHAINDKINYVAKC